MDIGDGAYVVIDKRVRHANDDQDTSSDDGNEKSISWSQSLILFYVVLFSISYRPL